MKRAEEDESLNAFLDPLHDEVRSMFILHYHNGLSLGKLVGYLVFQLVLSG